MQGDLVAALDAFDRVIAAADGLVDPATLDPVAHIVRNVRDRAGYLGDTVVAAVAGGTGSGKSSLVNALAGEVVTESGGMRPTTGTPLAWIPANPEPGLVRLLDALGVDEKVGQDLYPWLALLDLPDMDSVVLDHRHTVESLLPRVDLVLWVIDPEKYQDRVIHERYIRPLADYSRQFVFVLNQIDRLGENEVDTMVGDLRASLEADGIESARIVAIAADPDVGPPVGLDNLMGLLEDTVDAKRLVYDKLATDLTGAARRLGESPDLSGGVGFGPRWDDVRSRAAEELARGRRPQTESLLNEFIDELAEAAGGGSAAVLRTEVTPGTVSDAVEVAFESSGAYRRPETPASAPWVAPVRWALTAAMVGGAAWFVRALTTDLDLLMPLAVVMVAVGLWVGIGVWSAARRTSERQRLIEERRQELVEPIARQLESQLGRRLRMILRQRAGATAAATELNLALAELDRRLGR